MPVLLRCEGLTRRSVDPKVVVARAKRMLDALGHSERELSILLTGDPAMRELNRVHRKRDRATDVLAFPMMEDGELGPLLGDIVVSLDTARRQAKAGKQSIIQEVTVLMAHGLLHLIGYDHQTDAEEREMTKKTVALVEAAVEKQ